MQDFFRAFNFFIFFVTFETDFAKYKKSQSVHSKGDKRTQRQQNKQYQSVHDNCETQRVLPIQKVVHQLVLSGEKQNQRESAVHYHDDSAVDEMEDSDWFPGDEQVGHHDDCRDSVLVDVHGVDAAVEEKEPVNHDDDYRRVQAERTGDDEELLECCVFPR